MFSDEELLKLEKDYNAAPTLTSLPEKYYVTCSLFWKLFAQAKAANALAETLRFYADEDNYIDTDSGPEELYYDEYGGRARQALADAGYGETTNSEPAAENPNP